VDADATALVIVVFGLERARAFVLYELVHGPVGVEVEVGLPTVSVRERERCDDGA